MNWSLYAITGLVVLRRTAQGRRIGSHRDGYGVYIFANGDVYEGMFKADRMDGHGVYTFWCDNGDIYGIALPQTGARIHQ
jgi:hypothetical protein